MRVAAGILTYCDGDALRNALASVESVVDELVVCDGLVAGVSRIPATTPSLELELALHAPSARLHLLPHATQSCKRSFLLDEARRLDCEWLLQIDADEQLENPHLLRPWLDSYHHDVFPIPFQFEPGSPLAVGTWKCAWKCIRVAAWARVESQGGYLRSARDGNVYAAWPPFTEWAPDNYASFLPWISHHPDLRPPQRQSLRLGELENELEPAPLDALYYNVPGFHATPARDTNPS